MLQRILKKSNDSILLLGPRATGKSTWIRSLYSQATVYDLLNTTEVLRLARRPSLLFDEVSVLPKGSWVVIDEIQKVPALMDEVHRLLEKQQVRFVLSGSSARKLKSHGVNMLAGRALLTSFFPLVSTEVNFTMRHDYVYGMLPKAYLAERPQQFLRSYVETYLKEEVQAEALTRNIGGFARFLEVSARQNGQTTNITGIGRDSGVARQTVQGYFEILVDTLIGYWLPSWKLKPGTKQIAHPKFYFFDSGVCRALTGRLSYPPTPEERGPLFETWVLHELRAYLSYNELHYPLHYWSSYDQVEVDIIFETADFFVGIELKSTHYWERAFHRGLLRLRSEMNGKALKLLGVYCGEKRLIQDDIPVYPVMDFLKMLWAGELTSSNPGG